MNNTLLTYSDVMTLIGVQSRSTLLNKIKAGQFPQPIKIGARNVRFKETEVLEWIEKRPRQAY